MRILLRIKLLLYRFFSNPFGKIILQSLSLGIKVKNLRNKKSSQKYPFLIIITTDTESGYVDKNERRVWQKENPEAFVGYYRGIRNLIRVFDKHKIKTTFFLSTQCFSSKNKEYDKIKKELDNIIKKRHEIGLHIHPDSDYSIQKRLKKRFNATSAFFYSYEEKLSIIKAAKKIIKDNLGKTIAKNLISFRWGNWALDSDGAKALDKTGFKIDSSAVPGIKGHAHDEMKYDWSRVKIHYSWKLSVKDYQATNHDNSNIIEMPIPTFDFFGFTLRADPVNSLLLNKVFAEYYKNADRSQRPFPFVVITHSSEVTYRDGKPTIALKDLDKFIFYVKKFSNVEFVTLRSVYERLTKA